MAAGSATSGPGFGTPGRTLRGWLIALAVSGALNISLFGLMPGLIHRVPTAPDSLEEIRQIQVIRVKKSETPPRKKKPPKLNKPKPITQPRKAQPSKVAPKKIQLKPRLKFDINPRLPASPMDLVMPPLENFTIQAPELKDIYDVGELDSGLMALVKVPPIYPVRAKRRGIQGFVSVAFTVTPQGLVTDIRISKAEPEKLFNQSVMACVSQWKFKPPTVEGIPVSARARTTIRFKLEGE